MMRSLWLSRINSIVVMRSIWLCGLNNIIVMSRSEARIFVSFFVCGNFILLVRNRVLLDCAALFKRLHWRRIN